jgi:hypothetical protein
LCGGFRTFVGKKRESNAEKEQKKEERYESYTLDRERLELEKKG